MQHVTDLIDELSVDPDSVDSFEAFQMNKMKGGSSDVNKNQKIKTPPVEVQMHDFDEAAEGLEYVDEHCSLSDMKMAYEIMGIPFPTAAAVKHRNSLKFKKPNRKKLSSYLRKMVVKLPSGKDAEMILDLESNMEQQIELFLLSNNISNNAEIRKMMSEFSSKVLDDYLALVSSEQNTSNVDDTAVVDKNQYNLTTSNNSGKFLSDENDEDINTTRSHKSGSNNSIDIRATRKCKVRINLSDINFEPLAVDIVVQKGEILSEVAEKICEEYISNSDAEYDSSDMIELKKKVLDQLILAC
jgi:hypothetical protein